MAHITGGGLVENVPRVVPDHVTVAIDGASWPLPAVFRWLARSGHIEPSEMARDFNCGIGMVVVTAAEQADEAKRLLESAGETVYRIGTVTARGSDEGCVVSGIDRAWA
jgi:phosphoribosylaminoimidazole (AIR) synthetase